MTRASFESVPENAVPNNPRADRPFRVVAEICEEGACTVVDGCYGAVVYFPVAVERRKVEG